MSGETTISDSESKLIKRGKFYFIFEDSHFLILVDKTKRGLEVKDTINDEDRKVISERGMIYDMEGIGHKVVRTRHLDLGDHEAGRRVHSGEVDAGCLADHAAAAVAPDEVVRSQRRATGQFDVNAAVALREATTSSPRRIGTRSSSIQAAKMRSKSRLPERKHVVVASGEVADIQLDVGEARGRMLLTGRDQPLRDAPLIEHLDGARVETTGARSVELLSPPFDDDDVDVRQRQLARQHQPVGPPPATTTACSVIAAPGEGGTDTGSHTAPLATAARRRAPASFPPTLRQLQRCRPTHPPNATHPFDDSSLHSFWP